jgi:hypothetical protein
LKSLAGVENFAIKPHPYLARLGISDAFNRHSDLCDSSDFWDSIPEVALSLGSAATFELIYLDVPVVTIYPESFEGDFFPITGTYRNNSEEVTQALRAIRNILDNKVERDSLLRKQQQELSEMFADAPKSLNRIVSVIVAETLLG